MFIKITIEGTSWLLCNRFTDEAAQKASSGSSSAASAASKGTPKEQCEPKLYHDENGKLMIPGPNVMACITEGGKFFKAGKSKITTLKSSLIPACVFMQETVIPLVSKEGWSVDTRAVRNPSTGGRFWCHRPCFHDWALTFTVELDEDLIERKLFREIVDAAGRRIGLGDFRPACKGPFGRFVVTDWKTNDVSLLEAGK